MHDLGRIHDVSGLTAGELERARRDLQVSLSLAWPGSPVREPILAEMSAIDKELAGRTRTTAGGTPDGTSGGLCAGTGGVVAGGTSGGTPAGPASPRGAGELAHPRMTHGSDSGDGGASE
jgi:hypothetical protein